MGFETDTCMEVEQDDILNEELEHTTLDEILQNGRWKR